MSTNAFQRLISGIYKEHLKLNNKKTNNSVKNGGNLNISFKKEDIKWWLGTWKDVQEYYLSGKFKLKAQCDTTIHHVPVEWLKLKRLNTKCCWGYGGGETFTLLVGMQMVKSL